MSDKYTSTDMLSVEDARATVLEQTTQAVAEKVGLIASINRVLAQDIVSDVDIAAFENSSMDGFALRADDIAAASDQNPATLDIVGILGAGAVFEGEVQAGQALRIMTGAPMPSGADTVVKIEDTQVLGESSQAPVGTQVVVTKQSQRGANVRPRGEEALKGDILLHTGDPVSMAGVGLLASTGHAEVLVYGRPRVAILSTGSELVEVTQVPGPGQIRNSNTPALAAAVLDAGGLPTILPPVEDTREALTEALRSAVRDHDFVVMSGGAAEGDFDYTTPVIRDLGTVYFNKVNMRPGKAQTYGVIAGTPIFGLPGNPAAAAVGFEILVRPVLRKTQGFLALERPTLKATITTDFKKHEPRRQYLRALLTKQEDGSFTVTPSKNQSSAVLGALNESNCLLIVPEGMEPLAAGDTVTCLRTDIPEGVIL
jgi:molybdopterin molybdotransferase